MDIVFEIQGMQKVIVIEIGYFDSVLEIKEKLLKYHYIPVSKQTLIFNDKVLEDEHNVERCQLFHNSKVQLVIAHENNPVVVKTKLPSKIRIMFRMPFSKTSVPLVLDPVGTIFEVKNKISQIERVHANQLVVYFNGNELRDNKSLLDYGLSDGSVIDVLIKSSSPQRQQSRNTTSSVSNKLKITILTQCGTRKIPVEVNGSDNVGELRHVLRKLQQPSSEGCFFMYKQNVMDEDRSFRWHRVSNGDTIEIFNGTVTGGSS